MSDTRYPVAVDAQGAPPRAKLSNYPEPFAARMLGREKRPLGDLFGLTNFGVNFTRLAPGASSSLRHAHTAQDEFIFVLRGRPTLHTDKGRTQLSPGMCAGFKAGTCAPQKCRPPNATPDFSTSASSVIRFSGSFSTREAPASPRRSTRGASRPAPISLARAHPATIDTEVQPSRCMRILREGRVHRVPARCADAHGCSEQPTRAGSSGNAPRTSESPNPGTRA